MELLEGWSLAKELNDDDATGISAPLSIDLAVFVTCSVLSALSAAHEAGIVHRDMKPDNIFLVSTGSGRPKVKLLDFGIARMTEPGNDRHLNTLTRTGAVMGTPYFMSPEQALGLKKNIDQRTDIWAVGVILYKCVTGRYPFEGENYNQVMAQIISQHDPAEPSVLNPDVSPALNAVVARALRRDLDSRYRTCAEMLDDLRPLLGDGDLGLLGYHARRSQRRPAAGGAHGPDGNYASDPALPTLPTPSVSAYTPFSSSFEKDPRASRGSRWLVLVLAVALVAVMGVGGAFTVAKWISSRGVEPASGTIAPPSPRPAAATPIVAPPVPLPAPAALPAPSSPVVLPQPQVPPAAIAPAAVTQHPAPRSPEPPVVASPPAGGEADAAPPGPSKQPAEARPPEERTEERTGAERRVPERPRIQQDERRPPEPPRYPTRPPSTPNYGRELPQGETPVYGREL
jgi:serine/threonine-protein kinase